MNFLRLARWTGFASLAVAILAIGVWCSMAVWYECKSQGPLRSFLTGATAVVVLATVASLARPRRWLAIGLYSAFVALFLAWWATISPATDRNWAPDVARNVTATIDGDRVVINNVRDFAWRSETDFDPIWEQRTYALSHVTDVDLIVSY
jgi:hypothetical protein